MLLALPVIAAIFVSYIQFTFIRRDGYEWLRPLVWDALEDIKGIMRRRIPLWMQPLPAATTKLTLPAPIATDDLSVATTNQTLMNITPGKVPIFGFDNTLFDVPARIVLRLQKIRGTSLFYPLCGTTLFLCVAGFYTLWALLVTPTSKSTMCDRQEGTGRLKSTTIVHSVAPRISALAPFSEPISPNPPVTDLRKSASGAARVPGFVTPGLPMTPYVPESCLEPPVLGSSFPPATASESTWEELRVPSLIKSTDALDVDPSGRWHREVMMIGSGPCYSVQSPVVPKEYGRRNTTSRTLPSTGSNRAKDSDTGIICSKPREFSVIGEVPNSQSSVIPLITVEEYQEPSKTPTVGSSNCAGEPVECRLETGLHPNVLATHAVAMDDSAEGSSAIDQWTKDEPESTLGDLDVSKLGTSFSIVCVRSGDSTPRAAPETTERPESSVGSTPDLLHIQTGSRDLEESLVSRSTTPATWVGFVALRDSLIHLCSSSTTQRSISGATDGITPSTMQDMDDFSTVNLLDHDSVWINDHEDSLEPLTSIDSTHVVSNTSNGDKINTHGHSECSAHPRMCSNSSISIGWMAQNSVSTHPGTPLITPSNSMTISQPIVASALCPKVPLSISRSSTDFIFENQLSVITSSPVKTCQGYILDDANGLDAFERAQPSRLSDTAPNPDLSPEIHMLQSFLDDRTYAEVAGIPSTIESARATLSLRRWRIPSPGPQRPQLNGPSPSRSGHGASDIGDSSWAGHRTANSMWARPSNPNSRGFGSRRGRARRTQQV